MPKRIQRKRTKGWRMPKGAVYVGRGSAFGNPFNATQIAVAYGHKGFPIPLVALRVEPSLDRCLDMYQAYLYGLLVTKPWFLDRLKGKDLACWCPLDRDCHADILLRLANEE